MRRLRQADSLIGSGKTLFGFQASAKKSAKMTPER
jgi:hypothetical protein